MIAEDAVFQYPYSEGRRLRQIRGRPQIAAALRQLSAEATDWRFSDFRLFETPHPDVFFIQYRGRAYVTATHRTYDQVFLARITVRDRKIADYYELWDRDVKAVAFGTPAPKKRGV